MDSTVDPVPEALATIVGRFGNTVLSEPRRLRGLLNDELGWSSSECKDRISLLCDSLDGEPVEDLLSLPEGEVSSAAAALAARRSLSSADAAWVVSTVRGSSVGWDDDDLTEVPDDGRLPPVGGDMPPPVPPVPPGPAPSGPSNRGTRRSRGARVAAVLGAAALVVATVLMFALWRSAESRAADTGSDTTGSDDPASPAAAAGDEPATGDDDGVDAAEFDEVVAERDALAAERDSVLGELDGMTSELAAVRAEADQAIASRAALAAVFPLDVSTVAVTWPVGVFTATATLRDGSCLYTSCSPGGARRMEVTTDGTSLFITGFGVVRAPLSYDGSSWVSAGQLPADQWGTCNSIPAPTDYVLRFNVLSVHVPNAGLEVASILGYFQEIAPPDDCTEGGFIFDFTAGRQ